MRFIACAENKRDTTARRQRCDPVQQDIVLTQLALVTTLELGPLARIVSEPLPQLRRRRELLHPLVDRHASLTHAARPQPVDEDATAIRTGCRLVRALELQHVTSRH